MRALLSLLFIALAVPAHAGSAALQRGADGHWRADARVNGRAIQVLVDTGASVVALTREDARAVGIDVRALKYDARVRTANGVTRAADVVLERVQIGAIRVEDVEAVVIERGLSTSLLGMSFLNRLERVEMTGPVMRLRD